MIAIAFKAGYIGEKARQVAGMEKWDFLLLTVQEGICRQYDMGELDRDLASLERRL